MNLDEIGQQDYADAELKKVIVPKNYSCTFAPYAIDRKGQRSTVLACINGFGVVGRPLFAVRRCFGDILVYKHLPFNSLEIVHTKKGYVNARAFKLYLTNIFIPSLRLLRERFHYNEPAILIMDNYEPHRITLEKVDLESENVIVHFLPPHGSDQMQPLDLEIFGIMKRYMNNFKNMTEYSMLTNQIIKIHYELYKACLPSNCKSSFRSIGIDTKIILINGKLTEITDFRINISTG